MTKAKYLKIRKNMPLDYRDAWDRYYDMGHCSGDGTPMSECGGYCNNLMSQCRCRVAEWYDPAFNARWHKRNYGYIR